MLFVDQMFELIKFHLTSAMLVHRRLPFLLGVVNLDCQEFYHDGFDCCTVDAQYMTNFTGTAPSCLTDARGQQTCADKYGPPPACWLTNKKGLTCDWLTKVLGGCDESLRRSKRPHLDLRKCADSCLYANCTQDYAVELVET